MSVINRVSNLMNRISHRNRKRRGLVLNRPTTSAAESLETRQLLAAQIVAPSVANLSVHPGSQVSFDVNYRTENPNDAPTDGLLLLMHYDSTKVTFDSATNTLPHGFSALQDQPDTADADNNAATDRVVRGLWFDVNGQWPGQSGDTRLFTANFTAANSLAAISEIGFTGQAATGHTFQASSLTIRRSLPDTPVITAPVGTHVAAMPTFQWTAAAGADEYELWINNRTADQTRVIHEQALATNQFTAASDLADGVYHAWVRAKNVAGKGNWSNRATFIVGTNHPGAPTVTGPTSSDTLRPQFTWNPGSDATEHELWINNITTGTTRVVHEQNLTTNSFRPAQDLEPGIHRVWVRASNIIGTSTWSSSFDVNVRDVNEAPVPVGPLTATFEQRPTFEWQPVYGASGYQLWVRTTNGNTVVDNIATTSWTPDQDLPAGPISWWVRSADATGNNGWSARSDINVEGRTTVSAPIGQVATSFPLIQWQAVDGATEYDLYVDNKATSDVVLRQSVTSTSFTHSSAFVPGIYRIWVKAINTANNPATQGKWSRVVEFTVTASSATEQQPSNLIPVLENLLTKADQPAGSQASVAQTQHDFDDSAEHETRRDAAPATDIPAKPHQIDGADETDSIDLLYMELAQVGPELNSADPVAL